jgi:hypothetical protein
MNVRRGGSRVGETASTRGLFGCIQLTGTSIASAGAMRAVFVVGCWVASTGLAGCWYFEDCPDNFGGIKEGQLLETTIIAPYEGSLGRQVESCGELGDLAPGTTTTWLAHLGGSAETCDDEIVAHPQQLSGAELAPTSSWTMSPTVTLPGGCTGTWTLEIHPRSSEPTFIGPPDRENPSWVLERTFRARGDVTLCADGAVPATCTDAFVAETRRIGE